MVKQVLTIVGGSINWHSDWEGNLREFYKNYLQIYPDIVSSFKSLSNINASTFVCVYNYM
jgi:hypothetical protein